MIWLLISLFLAGFGCATLIWKIRYRDKEPVGRLIEEYNDEENPTYWMEFDHNSISRISKSHYIVMTVMHHKGGSACRADNHTNKS